MCRECLKAEFSLKKEAEQKAEEAADALVEKVLDRITQQMHSNPNWQDIARREISDGIRRMNQ